jgi:predicted nucleic acid-binding protein
MEEQESIGKNTYFFDTYALFELIKGNPNYTQYKKDIIIITTKLNLMELHYILLRLKDKKTADFYYDQYVTFAIEFNDTTIKEANELKFKLNRRDVSYTDCIGYILAKKRNARFLTGDEQFKDLENVEFVK